MELWEDEDRRDCPFRVNGRVLTDVRCTGSSCAWWCGFAQECAVPLLAGMFSDGGLSKTLFGGGGRSEAV